MRLRFCFLFLSRNLDYLLNRRICGLIVFVKSYVVGGELGEVSKAYESVFTALTVGCFPVVFDHAVSVGDKAYNLNFCILAENANLVVCAGREVCAGAHVKGLGCNVCSPREITALGDVGFCDNGNGVYV